MPIRITGLQGVLKAHGKAKAAVKKSVADGLKTAATTLLKESRKLVPVDTGALKMSGRVEVNEKAGLAATASVVYGGGVEMDISTAQDVLEGNKVTKKVNYAYVVHERLDVYHKPPTQARFLADAIPKVRGTIASAMKRNVSVALGGFS